MEENKVDTALVREAKERLSLHCQFNKGSKMSREPIAECHYAILPLIFSGEDCPYFQELKKEGGQAG